MNPAKSRIARRDADAPDTRRGCITACLYQCNHQNAVRVTSSLSALANRPDCIESFHASPGERHCQPNIELVGAPALTGAKSLGSRQNMRVMSDA